MPSATNHRALLGFTTQYEVRLPASMQVGIDQLVVNNPLARLVLEYSPTSTATSLTLASPLVNQGEIVIEGGLFSGKGAELALPEYSMLSGGGAIRLTHDRAQLRANPTYRQFTNGPEHQIRGAGNVIRVVNEGVIDADLPGERLGVYAYRNDGIIRASNGGVLSVSTVIAGSGVVEAVGTGSKVRGELKHGSRIRSENGGLFEKIELVNPVVDGAVSFGTEVEIDGVLHNDGQLHITARDVKFSQTGAQSLTDVIQGAGEIVMGGENARLRFPDDWDARLPVYNSIRGSGVVGGGFEAFGTISADVPGETLIVYGVTNSSVIEARNGAHMEASVFTNRGEIRVLAGCTAKVGAHQTSTGVVKIDGAAVTLTGLHRGRLQAINGGTVECIELVNILDADMDAPIDFQSVSYLDGACMNRAQFILGRNAPGSLELGRYVNVTSIEGSGTITLFPANSAQVQGRFNAQCTIGAGQRIEGFGELSSFTHRGVLSPGLESSPFGKMKLSAIRLEDTSRVEIDLDQNAKDEIEFFSRYNVLDGTLKIRFLNGYVPEPCSERVVLSGKELAGDFDVFDLPAVPLGKLAIRSELGTYTLVYNPADHDGSTFVDTDDFTAFIADFEAGHEAADINHSGAVDGEDFADFMTAFEQGC